MDFFFYTGLPEQGILRWLNQLLHFGSSASMKPVGVEPKIMGKPPKSSISIGFSIFFTIHFGGPPLLLETSLSIFGTVGP